MVNIPIEIPDVQYQWLQEVAEQRGVTVEQLLVDFVLKWLDSEDNSTDVGPSE